MLPGTKRLLTDEQEFAHIEKEQNEPPGQDDELDGRPVGYAEVIGRHGVHIFKGLQLFLDIRGPGIKMELSADKRVKPCRIPVADQLDIMVNGLKLKDGLGPDPDDLPEDASHVPGA